VERFPGSTSQGLDLSTKARAIYLFAEELQISAQEAIELADAFVRYAEGNLDYWVHEELARREPNTGAACSWASWRGGLTGVRLALQGMVETPVDPELWTSPPGPSPP